MRYLYGDSAPFPQGYNFLETLEAFLASATRVVEVVTHAERLSRDATEGALVRQRDVETLDVFHAEMVRAIEEAANAVRHGLVLDYMRRLNEQAMRIVEEEKRRVLAENERVRDLAATTWARSRVEAKAHLDTFLRTVRLPVDAHRVNTQWLGGHYEGVCVLVSPNNVITSFALDMARVAAWKSPRRVSEFVQNCDLSIGLKKSFFKGTVAHEKIRIDEWYVTAVDLSNEGAEITVKKKPDGDGAVILRVNRAQDGWYGSVEHPSEPGASGLPPALDVSEMPLMEAFYLALERACAELSMHRGEMLFAKVDNDDVLEGGSTAVLKLIERFVEIFAPTVQEISRRSPSPHELSLKREGEGGRREELYLRKAELTNKLQPLPAEGRRIFAPLGLEGWVPGLSMAPPAVAPKG